MNKRQILPLFFLILFIAPAATAAASEQSHTAPEPRVKVITRPEWISGQVAVHIFSFPGDGSTLKSNTITVQIAVWGTSQERPVYLILDGEEAARIETPGYYRYEWDLQGEHHITCRDDFTLFQTAQFNIAPPDPAPATILLEKAQREMQEARLEFLSFMLVGSLAGVGAGSYMKRKTKKFTELALVPFAFILVVGYAQIEDLYAFIPLALTGMASYFLSGDFVEALGLLTVKAGGPEFELIEQDDEDRVIIGIGPKYWRSGFIKTKSLDFEEKNLVMFRNQGHLVPTLVVASKEETEHSLTIKCSNAIAELLKKEGVVQELTKQNQQLSIQNNLLEAGAVGNLTQKFNTALTARVIALMEGVNTKQLQLPGIFSVAEDVEKMTK